LGTVLGTTHETVVSDEQQDSYKNYKNEQWNVDPSGYPLGALKIENCHI
jgi:hypothetical protein